MKLINENIEIFSLYMDLSKKDKVTEDIKNKFKYDLGVELPESYIWCYENVAHFRLPIESPIMIIQSTKFARNLPKFPKNLLELRSFDFYDVCLNCDTGNVVYWWQDDLEYDIEFVDFESYVLSLIEDEIEYMRDEDNYKETMDFLKYTSQFLESDK